MAAHNNGTTSATKANSPASPPIKFVLPIIASGTLLRHLVGDPPHALRCLVSFLGGSP